MKILDKEQKDNNLQNTLFCHACNDVQIWDSFRKRDAGALSYIYIQHASFLFQYGLMLSPDTNFVMDCIHDLFEDLIHYQTTVHSTTNIRFYLFNSLKNKILRNHKNQHRTDTIHEDSSFLKDTIQDQAHQHETNHCQRKCLRKALNKLPERQKEVVYLRYIFDFSNREIVQIMNLSYQSVCNLLHKAIINLREQHLENELF